MHAMSETKPSNTLVEFFADPTKAADPIRLLVLDDIEEIRALIKDTHRWLALNFKEMDYIKLLGPGYEVVTLEFVYPVRADQTANAIVQLVLGTNVVTVRSFVSGEKILQTPVITGSLDITLYEPETGDKKGIAFCHHHLQGEKLPDVLEAVADIVADPGFHLKAMNNHEPKCLQKVHKSGELEAPTKVSTPIRFKLKGSESEGKTSGEQPGADLRFICQRKLSTVETSSTEAPLFPCVKPSGTYTVIPSPTGGPDEMLVELDTIVFVDYAQAQ
jgi:hypothetical protein